MPAVAEKPLLPPDEKFWQRYSPRHEFALSAAISISAHGLVFGGIVLIAFLSLFSARGDILKPPSMDAVIVDGGLGDDGLAGAPGLPGEPKTELASLKENAKNTGTASKFAS